MESTKTLSQQFKDFQDNPKLLGFLSATLIRAYSQEGEALTEAEEQQYSAKRKENLEGFKIELHKLFNIHASNSHKIESNKIREPFSYQAVWLSNNPKYKKDLFEMLQGELTKKEAKHIVGTIRNFTKKFPINSEIITDYIEKLVDILPNNYQEFTTLYQVFKALMHSKKTGTDWLESQDNQKLITDLLDFVESQTEYEEVAKSESVIATQDFGLSQPVEEVIKSNEQITESENLLSTQEIDEQLIQFLTAVIRPDRIRTGSSVDKLKTLLGYDISSMTKQEASKTGVLSYNTGNRGKILSSPECESRYINQGVAVSIKQPKKFIYIIQGLWRDYQKNPQEVISFIDGILAEKEVRTTELGEGGEAQIAPTELAKDPRNYLTHEYFRTHKERLDSFINIIWSIDPDKKWDRVSSNRDAVVGALKINSLNRSRVTNLGVMLNQCFSSARFQALRSSGVSEKFNLKKIKSTNQWNQDLIRVLWTEYNQASENQEALSNFTELLEYWCNGGQLSELPNSESVEVVEKKNIQAFALTDGFQLSLENQSTAFTQMLRMAVLRCMQFRIGGLGHYTQGCKDLGIANSGFTAISDQSNQTTANLVHKLIDKKAREIESSIIKELENGISIDELFELITKLEWVNNNLLELQNGKIILILDTIESDPFQGVEEQLKVFNNLAVESLTKFYTKKENQGSLAKLVEAIENDFEGFSRHEQHLFFSQLSSLIGDRIDSIFNIQQFYDSTNQKTLQFRNTPLAKKVKEALMNLELEAEDRVEEYSKEEIKEMELLDIFKKFDVPEIGFDSGLDNQEIATLNSNDVLLTNTKIRLLKLLELIKSEKVDFSSGRNLNPDHPKFGSMFREKTTAFIAYQDSIQPPYFSLGKILVGGSERIIFLYGWSEINKKHLIKIVSIGDTAYDH